MTVSNSNLKDCNDKELLLLLQQSNKSAFDQIFERYWKKVYSAGYKRLNDPEQVEEIVQDVFTELWTKRSTNKIKELSSFLHTCVKYQIFSLFKKGKTPHLEIPLDYIAEDCIEADSLFKAKELTECIEIWLKMQPEKRAEIFTLKYKDGLSSKDISKELDLARKTVQNQLLTSTNSLKDFLSK